MGVQSAEPVVGDTVKISPETTRYLTGEKPSSWVYKTSHVVRQVGSSRFPNGVLLGGIMSWVDIMGVQSVACKVQSAEPVVETVAPVVIETPVALDIPIVADTPVVVDTPIVVDEPVVVDTPTIAESPVTEEVMTSEVASIAQTDTVPAFNLYVTNRFTIGVRGGTASLMHDAPQMGKWQAGWDVLLDMQYAHYWPTRRQNAYGVLAGLAMGYSRSGIRSGVDSTYSVHTADGQIDYTIRAQDVKEKDGQLQLEIPVMFTMILRNGFFLNAGPKLLVPVYTHYNQQITSPEIHAYFPTEGVSISNEVITGLVQDNQAKTRGRWNSSGLNIVLSTELGYEWKLRMKNSLALGVYANYSVYDMYHNDTQNKSLIDVTAPSAAGAAAVNVWSATDTYARGMGYFDCGVKLAYHFNFIRDVKKK